MAFLLNDLHCHTALSSCSQDPGMQPQVILDFAESHGYSALCLTDHLWDADVPGSIDWYAPQNIEHVRKSLPLPKPKGNMPFYFGCETELPACGRPALTKEHFDLFDFVVIPPNHMHIRDLVRPAEIDTVEKMARFMEDRLENLLMQDLPFRKIGIAHLNCYCMFEEGHYEDVIAAMNEERMLRIFKGFAQSGSGIELNADCFKTPIARLEEDLLLYRIAKEAGCKFYCSSDAHERNCLDFIPRFLPPIIEALGLEAEDQYVIPV